MSSDSDLTRLRNVRVQLVTLWPWGNLNSLHANWCRVALQKGSLAVDNQLSEASLLTLIANNLILAER